MKKSSLESHPDIKWKRNALFTERLHMALKFRGIEVNPFVENYNPLTIAQEIMNRADEKKLSGRSRALLKSQRVQGKRRKSRQGRTIQKWLGDRAKLPLENYYYWKPSIGNPLFSNTGMFEMLLEIMDLPPAWFMPSSFTMNLQSKDEAAYSNLVNWMFTETNSYFYGVARTGIAMRELSNAANLLKELHKKREAKIEFILSDPECCSARKNIAFRRPEKDFRRRESIQIHINETIELLEKVNAKITIVPYAPTAMIYIADRKNRFPYHLVPDGTPGNLDEYREEDAVYALQTQPTYGHALITHFNVLRRFQETTITYVDERTDPALFKSYLDDFRNYQNWQNLHL